jgi:Mg-chelatase subunit ChlD
MPRKTHPRAVLIRLDSDTFAMIEAWQRYLDDARPGTKTTMSDAIRNMIAVASRAAHIPARKSA